MGNFTKDKVCFQFFLLIYFFKLTVTQKLTLFLSFQPAYVPKKLIPVTIIKQGNLYASALDMCLELF